MLELAPPPALATAASTVDHDRLDRMISRVAAGDRVAFRRLYAFMAMRVWQIVADTTLGLTDGVAVTRSTFVEVWHSAGGAANYDARDWMARVAAGRISDRLRLIDVNGHHVHAAERGVGADRHHQPALVDHDAHVHRELTALLGAGAATIRSGPGVFTRIADLDQALATIAAATLATAATGSH